MKKNIQNNKQKAHSENHILQDQSGFSMLEVLISVFVLVVGMMAAISLLSSGLGNSIDSRNQTIAGLLSQEGIELVRNIRDTNWVSQEATFTDIGSGDCIISPGTGLSCSATSFNLFFNPSPTSLRYSHNLNDTPTKFSRKIIITNSTSNEKRVTSEVIWGGTFPASIAVCNTKNKCAYSEVILTEWGMN